MVPNTVQTFNFYYIKEGKLSNNKVNFKKLKYICHTLKFTLLKCTTHWFFSIFTRLCNHYHNLISEHCCHPQKEPCTGKKSPHSFLPMQPQVTTNLLSISTDLFILVHSFLTFQSTSTYTILFKVFVFQIVRITI